MKRAAIISVILICAVVIAAAVLSNNYNAGKMAEQQSEPGVIQRDRSSSPFSSDFYLCGEWEYYPDTLLYAVEGQTSLPDVVNYYDPAVVLDNQFNQTNDRREKEFQSLQKSSISTEGTAYITIPSVKIQNLYHHRLKSPSSFRMVVKDLPPVEDGNMTLSLNGMIAGNFEILINGLNCVPMVTPYGYPAYFFPVPESGQIEVVIQTYATVSALNIAPRITFKGLSMVDFDNYRNVILCMASLLLAVFVIMMIMMFSLERRYLFLPFWIGLVFSLNYIVLNIWATGHISLISQWIPYYILPHIAWFLFAVGICLGCLFLFASFRGRISRRLLVLCSFVQGISLLLRLAGIFLVFEPWVLLLSNILLILVIFALVVIYLVIINNLPSSMTLFMSGFFVLISGSVVSQIHNCFGFRDIFIYFQPLSILIFAALVFINSKATQQQLLKRTRQLLDLEKESTKIQAAMLSSQIQPHFLYNTLTTIQEMCYVDADAAASLIVKFSQYLRTNIDFMNYEDLIPFTSELEHIHNFMYIQNARYKDALHFEEQIEFDDFLIPPLSVQPFIENAVKHGIMKKNRTGNILLHVYKTDRYIHIVIKNDGEKISRSSLKPFHSIDNIQKRLNILLKGEVVINFESDNPETIIEIRIPLDATID